MPHTKHAQRGRACLEAGHKENVLSCLSLREPRVTLHLAELEALSDKLRLNASFDERCLAEAVWRTRKMEIHRFTCVARNVNG